MNTLTGRRRSPSASAMATSSPRSSSTASSPGACGLATRWPWASARAVAGAAMDGRHIGEQQGQRHRRDVWDLVRRDRIVDPEPADRGATQCLAVCTAAERLAEIDRDLADVRALGDLQVDGQLAGLEAVVDQIQAQDLHRARRGVDAARRGARARRAADPGRARPNTAARAGMSRWRPRRPRPPPPRARAPGRPGAIGPSGSPVTDRAPSRIVAR